MAKITVPINGIDIVIDVVSSIQPPEDISTISAIGWIRCQNDILKALRKVTGKLGDDGCLHGHWEGHPGQDRCSVCGENKDQFWDNYCACCGAKMED